MARETIAPPLKAKGFRRTARVFWRNTDTVCQVISIKMSRWGSKTTGSFDLYLGVFWHEIEELLRNPAVGTLPPPESEWTFSIDLGWTTPVRLQKSWKVNMRTDLNRLASDILDDLVKYGLPWLDYRSKLRHVLNARRYLKRRSGGMYTSHECITADARIAFMAKLGKKKEANGALRRMIKNGHRKAARELARKLSLPL